ncbi:MAG TPA: SGNH/GDSL hydrolase family protein [Candidatus Saccharimonadales bacterium]|nr:SGNH/GDSL hydrolase family protein [Candidatus Saccharimonadales bacterium]
MGLSGYASVTADAQPYGTWANPSSINLSRIGNSDPVQHELGLFSNLDCSLLTYRTVASTQMQTGCFAPTAFGMFDGSVAIFNGTDEALPLVPYSSGEILAPWPHAASLVVFDNAVTGGWYLNLYKGMSPLQDQRNNFGQLVAKKISSPPSVHLKDMSGQPLIVNPQTIAFSQNGSWMIAETVYGYFVRINLASLEVIPFAASFNSPGGSSPQDSQVAVEDGGRYVAIGNGKENALRIYDLTECNATTWNTSACRPYEYWPAAAHQIGKLTTVKHLRFINDGLLSFETISTDPAGSSLYELSPNGKPQFLTSYLGLGDSYTSGEGAFDYIAGTDTDINKCHLSSRSYPLLLSSDLFSPADGHSVACSGAVINDIDDVGGNYKGQVKDGYPLENIENSYPNFFNSLLATYSPGYIPQELFVGKYQPKIITVSIGGNDIGFGDILETCVAPHIGLHPHENTCYDTYESRQEILQLIDRQIPRWIALYKQLQASSPKTVIYALGYPNIIAPTGNCGANVHLNKNEAEFAGELVSYLDHDIQEAARSGGVQYVDISKSLVGHRLCEATDASIAMNGLTSGTDSGLLGISILGRESYHPNALGQELIEQDILNKTDNLSHTETDNHDLTFSPETILNVPREGRPINDITFDNNLTTSLIPPGTPTTIQIDSLKEGMVSNSIYDVRLDGPSGKVLVQINSSASPNLTSSITIPATVGSGNHTIDVTGPGPTGKPLDIIQPVYVPYSSEDYDGDGISNTTDPCPYSVNSSGSGRGSFDDSCESMNTHQSLMRSRLTAEYSPAETPQTITRYNKRKIPVALYLKHIRVRSFRLPLTPSQAVLSSNTFKPKGGCCSGHKTFFGIRYFSFMSQFSESYFLLPFFLIL